MSDDRTIEALIETADWLDNLPHGARPSTADVLRMVARTLESLTDCEAYQ